MDMYKYTGTMVSPKKNTFLKNQEGKLYFVLICFYFIAVNSEIVYN